MTVYQLSKRSSTSFSQKEKYLICKTYPFYQMQYWYENCAPFHIHENSNNMTCKQIVIHKESGALHCAYHEVNNGNSISGSKMQNLKLSSNNRLW